MTVNTFPSWAHDEAALSGFPHISCGNVLVTEWRGCFWGKLPKPPSKLLESLDGKWESHRRARTGSRKYRLMPVIYFSQWRCFCSVTHSCSFLAEKLNLCSNFFSYSCLVYVWLLTLNFDDYTEEKNTQTQTYLSLLHSSDSDQFDPSYM